MNVVPINKIIHSSVVDGPGNRTTVFLQGCNIQCAYCHNPETQNLCNHCGICVKGCPSGALTVSEGLVRWDKEKCIHCDQCITVCPHYASPKIRWMTAEEVFEIVKMNIPLIRGITLSGGECTLYPEFISELFSLVKSVGLSCLIDSNGMIDFSEQPSLLENCDGVMLDIKAWDVNVYDALTGANNEVVKRNLSYLSNINKLEEVRIVVLPDLVDAETALKGIAETLGGQVEHTRLKLIKFRAFGVKGKLENQESPEDALMESLRALAIQVGFKNIIML